MLLRVYLSLSLLAPSFCSASVIQDARNSELRVVPQERALPIAANPPSLDLFNASAMQVETSFGNYVGIKCDALLYGGGLNPQSCFDALRQSPTGDKQESWGYQSMMLIQLDVNLPVKLFSGKHIPTPKAVSTLLD